MKHRLTLAMVFMVAVAAIAAAQDQFAVSRGSTFEASRERESDRSGKMGERDARLSSRLGSEIEEIVSIIKHSYAGRPDSRRMIASAINEMLQRLDPHSRYYTAEEFKELLAEHNGVYFGIGTSIANFERNGQKNTYVLAAEPNTPAALAGLKFGDRIVAVNGETVTGLDSFEVRDKIRGPAGTFLSLSIERADGTLVSNVRIRRSAVPQRSVTASMVLDNGVGYIALTDGFGYGTAAEFRTALAELKRSRARSLIVDLRGNGGGLLEAAVKIAETFLPRGRVIVSQRGRASDERVWRSRNASPETMPLALLVDGETASAAEIFAAAMQDNDRAVIVGEKTFGKGLVQDIIPLADGSGLALTSERHYAPTGRSIHREFSDAGLYEYFRDISRGALSARSTVAFKTAGGRTVYSGDGIQPDVSVRQSSLSTELMSDLFFLLRDSKIDPDDNPCGSAAAERLSQACATDRNAVFLEYLKLRAFIDNTARKRSIESDPTVRSANMESERASAL